MKGEEKASLPCYDDCPYMVKRSQTASSSCAILNYAYFLNVMKMKVRPYFDIRPLTICDEAHLIPDVVLGHFNVALTQYNMNRIYKIFSQVNFNFKNFAGAAYEEGKLIMLECFSFFQAENPSVERIIEYVKKYGEMIAFLNKFGSDLGSKNSVFKEMFGKEIKKLAEDLKSMPSTEYIEMLAKRPDDIFIESEFVAMSTIFDGTYKTFRHTMYDLSESEMCRNNFLTSIDKGVFMSATLGNIDEFAMLMGMQPGEYAGFRLVSDFDFSKSPINLTKSGFLNYAKFNENIGKVLSDCIKICEELHPSEKGIIHTSTFDVSQRLKIALSASATVQKNNSLGRYLFYENSAEKDACIKLMKSSPLPYIIIGPSLYEGIDLKYNQGRFNIICKAPYSAMTEYINRKIKRYPFWYERNTLEKLVQAIGRTNRAKDDWSKTYLLDGSLEKLIFKTQAFITARIAYKYLN
jgi:Rad3-related DNA helicase